MTTTKTHPRSSDFRYRSANYFAVQSLESLVLRGIVTSWYFEHHDNLFGVHTHSSEKRPLMLTGKEVGTFETGAVSVVQAIVNGGLTAAEVYKGVAGLKASEPTCDCMTEDPGDGLGERVVTHSLSCPEHPEHDA